MVDYSPETDDNTAPNLNSGDIVRRLEEIRQEISGYNDSIKVLREEDRGGMERVAQGTFEDRSVA